MKCGKKSAQKLLSEIEKENKKCWLIDCWKKNFSESDWESGNEWKVNVNLNYDNEWNVNRYNLKNKEYDELKQVWTRYCWFSKFLRLSKHNYSKKNFNSLYCDKKIK